MTRSAYATDASTTDLDDPFAGVKRATFAGLLAGIVFGLLVQFRLERMGAIGALYTLGDPSVTVGWVAHGVHSVLFGAAFGFLVDRPPLRVHAEDVLTGPLVGGLYALGLWAVNIAFIWPAWLGAVSAPNAPGLPYLAVMPLVGHLLYGLLLGAGFSLSS